MTWAFRRAQGFNRGTVLVRHMNYILRFNMQDVLTISFAQRFTENPKIDVIVDVEKINEEAARALTENIVVRT